MTPLDPALHASACLALAALWLQASAHKLRDLPAFAAAVANYRLLPARAVRPLAAGLAAAELALGFSLLVPGGAAAAAPVGAGLLGLYTGAIAANLLRGRRQIDCGCAGPGARRPLGEGLLARNAALIALALACALPVSARPLVWLDGVTITASVGAAALLYAAVEAGGTHSRLAAASAAARRAQRGEAERSRI